MKKVAASERLTKMVDSNHITNVQLDNLNNWRIYTVEEWIEYYKENLDSLSDAFVIDQLHKLIHLEGDSSRYVYIDECGNIEELDNNTLQDALNV